MCIFTVDGLEVYARHLKSRLKINESYLHTRTHVNGSKIEHNFRRSVLRKTLSGLNDGWKKGKINILY